VIEAITDPDVPPLPPHISLQQATAFMSSILKGDTDTSGMIARSAKQMLAGFTPQDKNGH
jgi:pyruvate dehydrogenase (quinone)